MYVNNDCLEKTGKDRKFITRTCKSITENAKQNLDK